MSQSKRAITLVKIVEKSSLSNLTYKIHLHTTPSFNLTFCLQVIIQKPKILQIWSIKRGITLVRIVGKSSLSNLT